VREAQRAGFLAEVVADPVDTRLPAGPGDRCFRIVQEALTNVVAARPGSTGPGGIALARAEVHLVIRDDGLGFDGDTVWSAPVSEGNLGVQGMQERAVIVGGQLDIHSAPGQGTEVHARFPLPPRSADQGPGSHSVGDRPRSLLEAVSSLRWALRTTGPRRAKPVRGWREAHGL